MELKVGDYAPLFSSIMESGENLNIENYRNEKNIVLYFYPKDDTPGCSLEAQGFRDNIEKFASLHTVVIGISKDSNKSHTNFKKKYSLPFDLISDEDTSIAQMYGVWVEKSMFGKTYMAIDRATFLIDKEGKIRSIWRNVKVAGHVLAVLKETEKLCDH